MGIKVFRIVLDGVVHEVEVEEIRKEEQRGEGRRNTAADTAAGAPRRGAGRRGTGERSAGIKQLAAPAFKSGGRSRCTKGGGGEMITAPLQGTGACSCGQ